MTGTTHLMVGAVAGAVVAAVEPSGWPKEAVIGMAALSATFPDLDTERSLVHWLFMRKVDPKMRRVIIGAAGLGLMLLARFSQGFLLAGLFLLLSSVLPHRTFTHSLLGLGMITWTTYLLAPELAPAVFAGYLSHLAADSMTPHGVPWLWPHRRCYRIAQIPTGSGMDHFLGLAAFFGAFFVWLVL
mgnify:CR=1 FL=1